MINQNFKNAFMGVAKATFITLSTISIPHLLRDIEPVAADIATIIGAVFICFKCYNEIFKWWKTTIKGKTPDS